MISSTQCLFQQEYKIAKSGTLGKL